MDWVAVDKARANGRESHKSNLDSLGGETRGTPVELDSGVSELRQSHQPAR
jgi:hypothetical protein